MTPRSRLRRWPPAAALAALLAVLLGTACFGPAKDAAGDTASDWPMFGGTVCRNMVNPTAKNAPDDWSAEEGKEKNVKWAAALGSTAYGGPTVAGGKVYVGTNNDKPRDPKVEDDKGVLMCFRESDGKFLWQAVHDKLANANENDFPQVGIASTPTVEGDRVYYVDNRDELVCADTGGKAVWRFDMIKELNVYPCQASACSPLVAGDLVFAVTGNGRDQEGKMPAPTAPSFVAVDKKTGKPAWQSNAPGERVVEGQWANPTYAEVHGAGQVLFPGGDGVLYGFEAKTGKLLWKFDCNPKSAEDKPTGRNARNGLVATPVVADGKVYIAVGRNPEDGAGVGHLWCIDLARATEKGATNKDHGVSPPGDDFDPKAAANKDSALVWHYGGFTGAKTGRKYVFGRTISACAVHDGLVYATELDGYLHCLDAKTGQKYWEHDLKATVWASPYYVDDKVYIGTENGDLFIFTAGKEKKEPRTIDMGHPVKSGVVVANGVLYVQTDSILFAIGKK
jgi:outer membrane protein assembly factor BamB